VSGVTIHPPKLMCPLDKDNNPIPLKDCQPGEYEGKPVTPVADIQAIVDDSEARPDAQVALTNGGGLRADVPAGELTYGQLYQAMPFDNRFAIVDVKGKHIRHLITSNLQRSSGFNSWGGLTVKARCKGGNLDVEIKVGNKLLTDDASYKLVTTDFLASGGDGVIGRLKLPEGSITLTDEIVRDGMADVLRKRKGRVDPAQLFSPTHRRIDYEGKRPVECGGKQSTQREEPD
jgi:5'-nucleotidase